MFSTDYPYEDAQVAADWVDNAGIDDAARRQVCWDNAATLFAI